jgi:hypothetical protein
MLPFPASDRAQARAGGNVDGSFFFPLLALEKGRRNPASERSGTHREMRAKEVARRHGSSASTPKGVRKQVRTGDQQPRARRGSTARRRARASVTCCRNR